MPSERPDSPGAIAPSPPAAHAAQWVRELSAACARGDRGAVETAHRRFGPGLRALFVKRLGGAAAEQRASETADDLCQRTWMMVWEALSSRKYDAGRAAISTFIYALGNMVWLRHMRAMGRAANYGRTLELQGLESVLGMGDPDPGAALAVAAEIEAVRAAMSGACGEALSEEERGLLHESARGESDRGLATKLGLAPSTVNIKKHKALEKLRRALLGRAAEDEQQPRHAARSGGTA